MFLRKGLSSSFCIALSEQILGNEALNMPGVSRDSLDVDFVSGSRDPVLGVFTPVTENLFVHFISWSFVAVNIR
jgi:hypothetical protein